MPLYSGEFLVLAAAVATIAAASGVAAILYWRLRRKDRVIAAAIDNISHGLAMFDGNARLVLSNQRYVDMYGMSRGVVKPGCTYRQLIEHRVNLGIVPEDAETFVDEALERTRSGPWTRLNKLPDGRQILAVQRPTSEGGWVSTHEDVTERTRFEVSLREQKFLLDTAVDNMTQGLLMFDAKEQVALFNERYIQIYGLSPAVVKLGCSYLELMRHRKEVGGLDADPEEYCRQRRARIAQGQPWSDVSELPDGRSIQSTVRPMPNGGWVSTHNDITERKRIETSLQEQKLQLDTALNNMTQGLTMFDADARLVLWNDRFLQMFNLSADVVKLGASQLDVIKHRREFDSFPSDPEEFCRQHRVHLAAGRLWNDVHELPDGRIIQATIRPMPNGGWVTTLSDITERKRIEVSLQEQKLRLDTAVNNMTQGLVMFNADARLVLCNDLYIEMFGLSRDIVKPGCSLVELMRHRKNVGVFTGDLEEYSRRHRARLRTGKPSSILHELADGRSIQSTLVPMPDGGWVSTHDDITERLYTQRRIEHLAHHDTLTGLPNRASFNAYISDAFEDAVYHGTTFAVLCIDLDRFKEINDLFGHAVGDGLLERVAERLSGVAGGAFVARLGGDEFSIVVTEGRQPEAAERLIDSLRAAMAETIEVGGHSLLSGVSIGVAIYPGDGSDAATLLANGDAALYRAKRDGRGGACFFDADLDRELRERRLLQHELRLAFERETIDLFYQPQASVNGDIIGFEALARWQHPERGYVDPDVFIRLAEDSGLIMQLGERILRQACREAATWDRRLTVAVNLSPVQFKHGDLAALVGSVLNETGLPPNRLELEITEGVLSADFNRASSVLRRLKQLGVRISIDDFGKGYSSLSYLLSFPFDKIKIDRSFIDRLDESPQACAVVRGVIGLAHGLSLPVLAEGVETEAQLGFLAREACDEVQGFLVGRPQSIDYYADVVCRGNLGSGRMERAHA